MYRIRFRNGVGGREILLEKAEGQLLEFQTEEEAKAQLPRLIREYGTVEDAAAWVDGDEPPKHFVKADAAAAAEPESVSETGEVDSALAGLLRSNRAALEAKAAELGIEDPAALENKRAVAEAILAKQAESEPAAPAAPTLEELLALDPAELAAKAAEMGVEGLDQLTPEETAAAIVAKLAESGAE